jgi:hypothetical protein
MCQCLLVIQVIVCFYPFSKAICFALGFLFCRVSVLAALNALFKFFDSYLDTLSLNPVIHFIENLFLLPMNAIVIATPQLILQSLIAGAITVERSRCRRQV